jgi:hypothetical protein
MVPVDEHTRLVTSSVWAILSGGTYTSGPCCCPWPLSTFIKTLGWMDGWMDGHLSLWKWAWFQSSYQSIFFSLKKNLTNFLVMKMI